MSAATEKPKEPGWVIKNIHTAAKGMMKASIIIMLIGLTGLFFSRHKIYNYLCGPFPMQLKDYKQASSTGFLHHYYVELTGDSITESRIGEYAVNRHSKDHSDIAPKYQGSRSSYYMFSTGDVRIMAKLSSDDTQNGWIIGKPGPFTFTGVLEELDTDDDLARLMRKYNPDMFKTIDLYILNSDPVTGRTFFTWVLLIVFGLIALSGILDLIKNIRRVLNPLGTNYGRGLSYYGDVHSMAAEVEKEYAKGTEKWECVVYTENWVLNAEIPSEEYPLGKRTDLKRIIVGSEKASKNSETKVTYTLEFTTGLEANYKDTKNTVTDINLMLVGFKKINPLAKIEIL
ncbi:MAG: hypothetical protein K0S33_1927 [Bacteroidetes bacterium]|jgi:hypothetical protein|nr:hypothetical protein [Bacteroidota bacterium]